MAHKKYLLRSAAKNPPQLGRPGKKRPFHDARGLPTPLWYLHGFVPKHSGLFKPHGNQPNGDDVYVCVCEGFGFNNWGQLQRMLNTVHAAPFKKRPAVLKSELLRVLRQAKRNDREREKRQRKREGAPRPSPSPGMTLP